ncbi:hypothetical protein [uncultured Bacteroides sp.]|uniref:hypothetical protein n=1 Tax=uncultured Bacteroides sp. TaxID=162156 RepID=UPI00259B62FF|nr:hypothetical protein [uncultured Bacteroides sp.]
MNRLLMAAALIVLAACGGVSTQNGNGTDKEGLNGKVHKVQTLIYNAKSQGNETVKDGKPDSYRETDFFPKEDTRIYNAAGQLDSVVSVVDAVKYITVYAYRDGKLASTIEDMYIGGDKTTSEYPVDASKTEYVDGNCIEHGDTERDYVVKDALGRVLKESAYSEMDDYLTVKEYTYNEKGWLETCVSSDDNKVSYDYPETDDRGNWTRMVITLNGQPYGIAERSITYYE